MGVMEMAIAIAQQVDRDEFFGMAGINGMSDRTYEPVSIGKGFQFREGNNAWIRSMRKLKKI